MKQLSHLDLFSGIGGFALAAQMSGGIETQQFVEIDPFCQKVLAKRFPNIPIHGDIKSFIPDRNYEIISAGFPCQDISSANANARGLDGERSGLFWEVLRILGISRPQYILLENVSALLWRNGGKDFGTVLWELSKIGYDAEWQTLSASSMGAPHIRKRVFIIGYRTREDTAFLTHANRVGLESRVDRADESAQLSPVERSCGLDGKQNPWETEPRVGRVADGIPSQVDRIRGLGNAIVPQCGAIAFSRILEIHRTLVL